LRCETFWEIEVSQSKKIWWGIPLFCEKKIKNPFLGSNIPSFFFKTHKKSKKFWKITIKGFVDMSSLFIFQVAKTMVPHIQWRIGFWGFLRTKCSFLKYSV